MNRQSFFAKALVSLVVVIVSLASRTYAQEPVPLSIETSAVTLTALEWSPESPNGETIVALPWGGGSAIGYRYIGPILAQAGYRLVALNPRLHAGSTGIMQELTLHDYAQDVVDVLDELQLDRIHMMGWALGNRVARTVATDHPSRVATVSLLAAGGLVTPLASMQDLGRLFRDPNMPEEEQIRLARDGMFSPQSPDTLIREFLDNLGYWTDGSSMRGAANRATPREEWWAGGDAPMLIVQGLDDRTAPPENGIRMKADYGDRIRLVNLEGAGHAMGLEKPEETASAVIDFLQDHPI